MVSLGFAARHSVAVAMFATVPFGCYVGLDYKVSDERNGGTAVDEGEGVERAPWSDSGQPSVDQACEETTFAGPLSQFVRLTHGQYDNAIRDLLGVELALGRDFLPDPVVGGFSNNVDQLRVNDRLVRDYQRAAEVVSEALLANPTALATLAGCETAPDDSCAAAFVDEFGRRAFRRPLEDDEREIFARIFTNAPGSYETGTDFEQGVALVVEAALQSPSFLYRTELSAPPEGEGQVALTGYEVASRLSFMLWNSTPDRELLDAADAGELDTPEGIAAHARRMLDDPRAADPIRDFHEQWLGMDHYDALTKDPETYPGFDGETVAALKEETLAFFQHTILDDGGTFNDLLTSRATWVNDELAAIYGLSGDFGPEFTRAEVDPSTRAGFLTHPGFLASHAYYNSTSPIHRGVMIQRQLLCASIPSPPGDVDLELPPFDASIRTTRQRVEAHTSPDACVGCHQFINEPGFAFEGYDEMGRIRETENGEALDTAGELRTLEGSLAFTDALNLIEQLADSPIAEKCYLTQWFRYASGRTDVDADKCTITAMHERLAETGFDVREMLVSLTQTVNFRFRVAQENT